MPPLASPETGLALINLVHGVGDDAGEAPMQPRAIAAAVAAALCFPVFSQTPDDAVVVTATRFEDAKRNLAVGVSVITADDIRASASSNLAEILAQYGL